MSLKIVIFKDKVHIPEFNLQFSFQPPSNNSFQKIKKLLFWLQDYPELQNISNKNDKKEVINILKNYGKDLYNSIIPSSLQSKINNNLNLEIEANEWQELPWELLNNDFQWFISVGSIKRLYNGTAKLRSYQSNKPRSWQFLNTNFVTSKIDNNQTLSTKFIYPFHNWIKYQKDVVNDYDWNFELTSNIKILQEVLRSNPRYLYLQGFSNKNNLLIPNEKNTTLIEKELSNLPFNQAIENGLELLFINFRQIHQENYQLNFDFIKQFFKLGIPTIINFSGLLEPGKINCYMSNFISAINKKKEHFIAHQESIKTITAISDYNWDWIWIQFYFNQKSLSAQKTIKTSIVDTTEKNKKYFLISSFWQKEKFYGDLNIFLDLQTKIYNQNKVSIKRDIICLNDELFQNSANYLNHFSIVNYKQYYFQSLNYSSYDDLSIIENLAKENQDFFQLVTQSKKILEDDCQGKSIFNGLYNFQSTNNNSNNLLQIFVLNGQISKSFIEWLLTKKETKIILVIYENQNLIQQNFNLSIANWENISHFFNQTEKKKIEIFLKKISSNRSDLAISYRLLKLICLLNINANKLVDKTDIWNLILEKLKFRLSNLAKQIVLICYLFQEKISEELLQSILTNNSLKKDLEQLRFYTLIETTVNSQEIKLESGFHFLLTKYNFFTEDLLQKTRIFLLTFFCKKKIAKTTCHYFTYFFFFNIYYLLKSSEKENTLDQLKIFLKNDIQWKFKKIIYFKILEQFNTNSKNHLLMIYDFYSDALFKLLDKNILENFQNFISILEKNEKWEIFFKCQILYCKHSIFKYNFTKAKNFLGSIIEYLQTNSLPFKDILDVAFLLIDLGDKEKLFSFLEYFLVEFKNQESLSTNTDQDFLKAYKYYCNHSEEKAFEIIDNKVKELEKNSDLKIDLFKYSKIYSIYILLCAKFNQFKKIKKIITSTNFFNKDNLFYYPLQNIIASLFEVVYTYQGIYLKDNKIDYEFLEQLENLYSLSKQKHDKNIAFYADVLGRLCYKVNAKKKYKIYLEEFYKTNINEE